MKSPINKFVFLIVFIMLSMGCSSNLAKEFVYVLAQSPSENQCQFKRPQERDSCLINARNRITYEQYKKEREIINGNKQSTGASVKLTSH
ncbi:hypothetical protein [Brumicola pallidula]|uniref:Lipoprotein n=1 Tax=Brumicola pallidula DSM 14239 = ACAM 615 TaxID=1121922 RepID=K6Y6I3_9ALTE|nr:hypothetical protein [Glaciecola pallidula]GAC28389.1 hypothetical protein GPAL_1522 [Glaciecola pallidula DSM 14239 = ACAM 615]